MAAEVCQSTSFTVTMDMQMQFTYSNWVWLHAYPVLQFPGDILKWVWLTKVLILLQDLTIYNSFNNRLVGVAPCKLADNQRTQFHATDCTY